MHIVHMLARLCVARLRIACCCGENLAAITIANNQHELFADAPRPCLYICARDAHAAYPHNHRPWEVNVFCLANYCDVYACTNLLSALLVGIVADTAVSHS